MSVTVVGRWHVPVGEEGAAIAAAQHELAASAGQPLARREAHIFQALDDPATLLYVGEWSDRASFEMYRRGGRSGIVESAVTERGEYVICERLVFFGNFAYRAQVVACGIVESPPESADAVRDLLLPGGRWRLHGWPGLVHYAVYREVSRGHRYVMVHGWQSAADLQPLIDARGKLEDVLAPVGATIIRFVGCERASTGWM